MQNRYNLSKENFKLLRSYRMLLKKMHRDLTKSIIDDLHQLTQLEDSAGRIKLQLERRSRMAQGQLRDNRGRFATNDKKN